eukprot:tig00000042_g15642.t2
MAEQQDASLMSLPDELILLVMEKAAAGSGTMAVLRGLASASRRFQQLAYGESLKLFTEPDFVGGRAEARPGDRTTSAPDSAGDTLLDVAWLCAMSGARVEKASCRPLGHPDPLDWCTAPSELPATSDTSTAVAPTATRAESLLFGILRACPRLTHLDAKFTEAYTSLHRAYDPAGLSYLLGRFPALRELRAVPEEVERIANEARRLVAPPQTPEQLDTDAAPLREPRRHFEKAAHLNPVEKAAHLNLSVRTPPGALAPVRVRAASMASGGPTGTSLRSCSGSRPPLHRTSPLKARAPPLAGASAGALRRTPGLRRARPSDAEGATALHDACASGRADVAPALLGAAVRGG